MSGEICQLALQASPSAAAPLIQYSLETVSLEVAKLIPSSGSQELECYRGYCQGLLHNFMPLYNKLLVIYII